MKRLSRYILNKGRGSYPERLDQLAEEINLKPSTRREKEKWNLVAKKIGQLGYASPDHFDTDIKNIHKERNLIAHPNDFPTGNNVVNSERLTELLEDPTFAGDERRRKVMEMAAAVFDWL